MVDFQQTLQLRNRFSRMYRLGCDTLGAVDAASAANGYDGFAAVFLIGLVTQFHIVRGRIGGVIGLQSVTNAVGIETVQHGLYLSAAHHAGAGDHQNIIHSSFPKKNTQILNSAGTF